MSRRRKPLDGVRVLDLSRVVAGPSCTRSLADLGADVIKVEPPEGDITRKARPRRGGISLYFSQLNAGKRCVCVDLGRDEGRRLVLDLAARCDVVVENFRPGVMARLGLAYDDIRAVRADVVYCSISGWGQEGPARQRRAYAPVIHAEVGLLDLAATHRGHDPMPEPVSHADFAVGAHAAQGILAALFHRARTGEGTAVDVSMAEAMLASMEWTAIEANGGTDGELSVFDPAKATIVRLGDGSSAQLPGNPAATFPAMCRLMGRTELLRDERFSTLAARSAHLDEVDDEVRRWAATFPDLASFEAACAAERVAVGAVLPLRAAPDADWAQARGAFTAVDDGEGGVVLLPTSPLRFSGLDAGLSGPAAHQGAHNRQVLGELLGLDEATVDRLTAGGVLCGRRGAAAG